MICSGLHFRFALATMCSSLGWQVGSQGYELRDDGGFWVRDNGGQGQGITVGIDGKGQIQELFRKQNLYTQREGKQGCRVGPGFHSCNAKDVGWGAVIWPPGPFQAHFISLSAHLNCIGLFPECKLLPASGLSHILFPLPVILFHSAPPTHPLAFLDPPKAPTSSHSWDLSQW